MISLWLRCEFAVTSLRCPIDFAMTSLCIRGLFAVSLWEFVVGSRNLRMKKKIERDTKVNSLN